MGMVLRTAAAYVGAWTRDEDTGSTAEKGTPETPHAYEPLRETELTIRRAMKRRGLGQSREP
jgi:hypothetical protein